PICIHVGDVVEESDGDLMGDGVNIAARLESIAKPGAICLSEQAYWQVKGRLDLAVHDLGPTQLKNIAEPMRVYSLEVGQPAQAKPASTPASEKPAPPRLSIVVLPFFNIGHDPEQEPFVDGVTESLTTDLSRIRSAVVIARNTAFAYKGKPLDVKTIGRIDTDRLGDVLQFGRAEIAHPEIEPPLDLPVRLLGQTDRAGLGDPFQSRC